jgi:hypothetical protein
MAASLLNIVVLDFPLLFSAPGYPGSRCAGVDDKRLSVGMKAESIFAAFSAQADME